MGQIIGVNSRGEFILDDGTTTVVNASGDEDTACSRCRSFHPDTKKMGIIERVIYLATKDVEACSAESIQHAMCGHYSQYANFCRTNYCNGEEFVPKTRENK